MSSRNGEQTRPSSGWTGSITAASSSPSATFPRPNLRQRTIVVRTLQPSRLDSCNRVSGNPGPVQPAFARPACATCSELGVARLLSSRSQPSSAVERPGFSGKPAGRSPLQADVGRLRVHANLLSSSIDSGALRLPSLTFSTIRDTVAEMRSLGFLARASAADWLANAMSPLRRWASARFATSPGSVGFARTALWKRTAAPAKSFVSRASNPASRATSG